MENNVTGAVPVTCDPEEINVLEFGTYSPELMQAQLKMSPFKRFKSEDRFFNKNLFILCNKGFPGDREMMLDRATKLNKFLTSITSNQGSDVKALGFGGILSLNLPQMIQWLENKNNTLKKLFRELGGKPRSKYTPSRIHDVFGLTCNPCRPVLRDLNHPQVKGILESWKTSHSISYCGNFRLEELQNAMLRLGDGGPDFKRMFIIFVLLTFLTPADGLNSVLGVLNSLINVEDINDLDWAGFVCDHFHQTHKASTETWNIGGCAACAQIWFLFFFRLFCTRTQTSAQMENECGLAKLSLNQGKTGPSKEGVDSYSM